MEENSYLKTIRNYISPSFGLSCYLNLLLKERTFKKKETLKLADEYCAVLLFISSGTLRLYTIDAEEETTLLFWHQHQFIVPMATLGNYTEGKLFIEFLDDATLTGYSDKHTANLYKLFPEYRVLMNKLYQHQLAALLLHTTALSRLNANARFNQLMHTRPELFNLCDLKTIASYLGIHPKVLSRLRSKAVKK
ncbi:cAMP-binding domain of CRP or a regulatory subunit of cAMP-dependent protein kinases [Pedobacter suwonensis]|uniref:cAMP-binding domain of CRP or a regulatory subunit of cAMP-dependent protein kinases n=1 Tax=Pedobacter suwonensis TaxID=332999 RepID=A0A1I0SRL4_9SPHI|nr:Crp/Fnr family transcriptional regulator [Pedobacter suwonensis]SFA42178.1 cAMP-binding domain of CRP or a regulatory subunit of cAMP-dependent protein kinases [Pedobacter suwonensis]